MMSKFVETEYMSTKEILKFPDHYVALAVMVSDSGIVANEYGKKIVTKGTIVGGATAPVLGNLGEAVVNKFVDAAWADIVTGSAGSDNAIKWTAVTPGTGGNAITVALADPIGNDQPLAITVTGAAISVSVATGPAGAIVSTAAEVAGAVNAHAAASALVTADANLVDNNGGSGVVAAVSATNLTGGHNGVATGAEGVLQNDIDVTYGPKEGAMILHGFIKIDALPYAVAKKELAVAAAATVLPMIKFIK